MPNARIINTEYNSAIALYGQEQKWQVVSITGLTPAAAQINTTTHVNADGAEFNSARLQTRNIVVTLHLTNDPESARLQLEDALYPKAPVRFEWTGDTRGTLSAYGYVESFNADFYTIAQMVQISILCPDPFFYGANYATVVRQTNTIVTGATRVITGVLITATIIDATSDGFEIINVNQGTRIFLEHAFEAGDVITIDTRRGRKSITVTRNGAEINVFGSISEDSTFFGVRTGEAVLKYSTTSSATYRETADVTCHVISCYAGV